MPDLSQLNFETIIPAVGISKIYGYVVIPAFSYSGIIWKESSEEITQYNYTASKNFILRELPVKPVGVNFCPVIRFRVGLTTYRYKLWSGVGERLQVEDYTGQIIKKNFVIEIWNIETSSVVSLTEAITLTLSIKKVPTDWAAANTNYSEDTGEEVYPVTEVPVYSSSVPATALAFWYRADSEVTISSGTSIATIGDKSGNGRTLDTPSGTAPALSSSGFGNANGGAGSEYVSISANTRYIGRTSGSAFSTLQAFILVRQSTWSAGAVIFTAGGMILSQNGTAGQLRFTAGVTTVTVDAGTGIDYLVELLLDYNGSDYDLKINVYDLFGDLKFTATGGTAVAAPATSAEIYIGYTSTSALCRVAEVFAYTAELTSVDKQAVIDYVVTRYNDGNLPVEYTVSDDVMWLDNE